MTERLDERTLLNRRCLLPLDFVDFLFQLGELRFDLVRVNQTLLQRELVRPEVGRQIGLARAPGDGPF